MAYAYEPKMDFEHLQVLALHKHPEYTKDCCDLINDEWPRSDTARLISLQASCDNLPTSLILVNDQKKVLGHCKLTPIPSIPESCFIETVVIGKTFRGKKLGTYLMKKAEQYCREVLNLKMLHLSTKGQENFYAKLGFTVCEPISIFDTRLPIFTNAALRKIEATTIKSAIETTSLAPIGLSRPPTPPPPPLPKHEPISKPIKSQKTFMLKHFK